METTAVKEMKRMIEKHGITCTVDALCEVIDERKAYSALEKELEKHGY